MTGTGFSGAATHFVYQRVHVLDDRPLHLVAHLRLVERALKSVYGIECQLDTNSVADIFRDTKFPAQGSATALVCFFPDESKPALNSTSTRYKSGTGGLSFPLISVEPERRLLKHGYSHSPLRPVGVTFSYSIPYADLPTSLGLATMEFFDFLARRETGGSARSIRCDGNRLISAGDAALFGIRGKQIFTAPIEDGVMESIERQAVMELSQAAGSRLELIEQAVEHSELTSFDELFLVDAAGITSFSECDGAKFSALIAPRLLPRF